nr:MAG TPA: hypothetical protein [Bacteriophage sp.]
MAERRRSPRIVQSTSRLLSTSSSTRSTASRVASATDNTPFLGW